MWIVGCEIGIWDTCILDVWKIVYTKSNRVFRLNIDVFKSVNFKIPKCDNWVRLLRINKSAAV